MSAIQQSIQNSIAAFAAQLAELETFPPSALMSAEARKQEYKEEVVKNLDAYQAACTEGFALMAGEISNRYQGVERDKFVDELDEISSKFDSEEKRGKYTAMLKEGKSLRAVLPISDFFINALYKAATPFIEKEQWNEAISCFLALSLLDPNEYVFLLLLGVSYFHTEKYQEAIMAYTAASLYAPDTSIFIYFIECLEKMGEREKAKECAERGLQEEKAMDTPDKEKIELFEKLCQQFKS